MPSKSHPRQYLFGIFNDVPFVTVASHSSHKRTGILGELLLVGTAFRQRSAPRASFFFPNFPKFSQIFQKRLTPPGDTRSPSSQDFSPGLCQAGSLISSLGCQQPPGKVPACFINFSSPRSLPQHTQQSKTFFSAQLQVNSLLNFLIHFQKL